jgi:hypothetical protein
MTVLTYLRWIVVIKARHHEPQPLTALEQTQGLEFLWELLTTVPLPMAEVREMLFSAGRA